MADKETKAENDNKTDELLKQVLAEVKAINERNKKADSEEERRNKEFEINNRDLRDLAFVLFGVALSFLAQAYYDFYGSSFPKPLVGVIIALAFCIASISILYTGKQNKKYRIKKS